MAQEEIKENKALIEQLEADLNILMIPKDPNDANSAYLEIRAGTGGDEVSDFLRRFIPHVQQICRSAGLAFGNPV